MFTMNIEFSIPISYRAMYSKMTIDEIYDYLDWDATLTIKHNNQIFFEEEIAIVEFYWHLLHWYRDFLSGQKQHFIYSTVEHTEPILVFSLKNNNDWAIDSIWKKHEKPFLIKEEILIHEVKKVIKTIMYQIEKPDNSPI
ncbi:MAG: hypothetical protein E7664_03650 [Ruminococcaceae bacterium]|nr:hypothetical protein [Oscillospiraceae bacterium]